MLPIPPDRILHRSICISEEENDEPLSHKQNQPHENKSNNNKKGTDAFILIT